MPFDETPILPCSNKTANPKSVSFVQFYHLLSEMLILLKCQINLGRFCEALAIHKKRLFRAQTTWTAANLSRWDLLNFADGHESKFIENIIQVVLQEVNQTPLDVAWYSVGVDTRVKDIELLLRNECVNEVHMVGIGGIGKTNLAKDIYNQLF